MSNTSASTRVTELPPPCPESLACAAALERHRGPIARGLLDNLGLVPRWAREIQQKQCDLDSFVARELHVLVDYVRLYFQSGDQAYAHLYIGEKLKQTYEAGQDPKEAAELRATIAELDAQTFLDVLRPSLDERPLGYLKSHLGRIGAVLSATGKKTLSVLFIQDCLYLDILAFLTAPLLDDGITLAPCYATSKNPEELRQQIREASQTRIDSVFFSPFTYEFSPPFARLLLWKNSMMTNDDAQRVVQEALSATEKTLDLVCDLFDCHVFVHNTATVIREPSPVKRRAKNLLSRRVRSLARGFVTPWIDNYVSRKNADTFDHVFVVDETDPLRRFGDHALGALFYSSQLQHPAVLGRAMADIYRDLLFVEAFLVKKKLVVCDLDNTLWEGLIGEGEIRHYADRQQALKDLRQKGVVLAVNSKNDPANVRWNGCILSEDDFVCREISWEPKVNGMRRIQTVLNLKLKDYVFIDDRADEREMISTAFPDIFTMDAAAPRTWRLVRIWSSLLDTHPEMDRTLLYRQREERQSFLQSEEGAAADTAAMFKTLDLRLQIRKALPADLKRVVELVNRTNQFNLCATRTSFAEAASWANHPQSTLIVAHATDRFGDMGMVCAALARETPAGVEIPVFVLSCRVFGYRIEDAVMNHVKRLAQGRPITGWYKETAQNGPCKNFYPNNGFSFRDGAWHFTGDAFNDPAWLAVTGD